MRGKRFENHQFTGRKFVGGKWETVDKITKPELIDMIFKFDDRLDDLPGSRK